MTSVDYFLELILKPGSVYNLAFDFGVNILILTIIIKYIYLPKNRNKQFVFTFFLFNIAIFFLCNIMGSTQLNNGFAFGLFAVLSILRYRTESIPIKEMTYMFIGISLGVINGLVNKQLSIDVMIFTNVAIVVSTYVLEKKTVFEKPLVQHLLYENMELLSPLRRDELIADLIHKTGLLVTRIEIGKIDLVANNASIKVYYDKEEAD